MKKFIKVLPVLMASVLIASCGLGSSPTEDPTETPTETPTEGSTDTPTEVPTETPTETPVPDKEIIDEDMPANARIKEGDQMYNIELEDIDGFVYYLKDELMSKDLVVINIFASWCGPCMNELPAMEAAYRNFETDMTFFAISCEPTDTVTLLKQQIRNKFDITFPICQDLNDYSSNLLDFNEKGEAGIPQSIFIDRYGTVVKKHTGTIPTEAQWTKLIEEYIGDDYCPPVF